MDGAGMKPTGTIDSAPFPSKPPSGFYYNTKNKIQTPLPIFMTTRYNGKQGGIKGT